MIAHVPAGPYFYCVSVCQGFQGLWQFFLRRHLCPVDEHGNNGNVPIQGCFNFYADKISGIIDAARQSLDPSIADNGEQDVAGSNLLIHVIAEIDTQWNGIDIKDDRLLTEARR